MTRALAAYRGLLRTFHRVFKEDHQMLAAAHHEAREKFKEAAQVTEPAEVERLCQEAEEAASFVSTYVVQAKLNERGNYEMAVEPHHAEAHGTNTLEAVIPEETELPQGRQ